MRISVVIPILNERANLPTALDSVRAAIVDPEIIVVDGGSIDGSLEWLETQPDIHLVQAMRGKGPQQNAGGQLASGDVILFLHADCRLPKDAEVPLQRITKDPDVAGGCFLARWSRDTLAFRFIAFGMNLRTMLRKTSYGDQALFARRTTFHEVGGFPDWPLFEDTELVRRIKNAGRFTIVRSKVTMSARRFEEHGIFHNIFLVYLLQIGFMVGVPPARLKKWFTDVRPHMRKLARS
jgi:rSAM/selenodomain-associated transferase 2